VVAKNIVISFPDMTLGLTFYLIPSNRLLLGMDKHLFPFIIFFFFQILILIILILNILIKIYFQLQLWSILIKISKTWLYFQKKLNL